MKDYLCKPHRNFGAEQRLKTIIKEIQSLMDGSANAVSIEDKLKEAVPQAEAAVPRKTLPTKKEKRRSASLFSLVHSLAE